MRGIDRIKAERIRQVDELGYDDYHDTGHSEDLIRASSCYTQYALMQRTGTPERVAMMTSPWEVIWENKPLWPWAPEYWKPGTIEENLIKAAALAAAALDSMVNTEGEIK
jgi:hypothetical protein